MSDMTNRSVTADIVHSVKNYFGGKAFFNKGDLEDLYTRDIPSFADKLPYSGYDSTTDTFILEDCISRAVCLTIDPITTEGRSASYLNRVRDAIKELYNLFEEKLDSQGQWVIQEFTYDDSAIEPIMKKMRDYVAPHAKDTEFTKEYMKTVERHLRTIQKDDGLFKDDTVTGEMWSLKIPRTKFIIYRRISESEIKSIHSGKFDPARELNEVVENIKVSFSQARISIERDNYDSVFNWLFRFFNPKPDIANLESKEAFYEKMTDVDGDMLVGRELCEALLTDFPVSSVEDNCWYLNGYPTRFLRFGGLRQPPRIGQLSGEVISGDGGSAITKCLSDTLPAGTILTKTVVITSQSEFESRFAKVAKNSNGENAASESMLNSMKQLRSSEVKGQKKVLTTLGAYIVGEDLHDLDSIQRRTITALNNNNIIVYRDDLDGLSLKSFLNHLPMNFRPSEDKKRMYLRSMWAQHAANLSLAFGRSEGSGNPCLFYFNRGGAPVFFDPFSRDEKENNSFGFIVGGPGSGKSVNICWMVYSIAAMKRPRIFIVEYGNSFEIAAKDWKKKGLNVNEVVITPKNCPSLAPFSNIDKVLDSVDLDAAIDAISSDSENGAVNDDDVDVLGELEQLTFMMITGSEQREMERYNRGDVALVRRILVLTAKANREVTGEGNPPKKTITSDVMNMMRKVAQEDESLTDKQRDMLKEMSFSLEGYTTGFNAKLFDREGEAWPDADVTLINLGTLAQPANRDKLNVAYTSLMQYVNNLAESTQKDARDIVMLTDEAHLLTSNEMLSKLIVTQVKTSRKLGCWPFFATQNVNDMSGEAQKLLSMIEWFYCLNTSKSEAEEIAKYKTLSAEQISLITSTKKQARGYTEGVVLSGKNEFQIRSVPPSLILAVAMTESEEKAERMALMKEMSLSCELEAAYEMANKMDKARGINGRIEFKDL